MTSSTLRAESLGSPSLFTLVRLAASGGRSDRLRIALTTLGATAATLTTLAAASVAFISEEDGPYDSNLLDEPGLRPGVMIAILLLTVPLVVFVGLCTRVGAPARDRRLAMFRMAGATPSEATRIAAFETGIAALMGSVVGTLAFFIARPLVDSTTPGLYNVIDDAGTGYQREGLLRSLPTDVAIPPLAVLALVAVLTLGAVIASSLAMRRVRISPFSVTRTTPSSPPAKSAALLFTGGTAGLVVLGLTTRSTEGMLVPVAAAAMAFFLMCIAGLMYGSAAIASLVGRFLAPRVSRPDLLIASRRMIAAPYASSRATASVLLAVLIGAAVQGTRANFLAGSDPADTFYADTFTLLDWVLVVAIALTTANLLITSAEAIVERRRTLAMLTAGGTPRSVLARAAIMEAVVPLVPSILLAGTAGLLTARAFFGTSIQRLATFEVNGTNELITVGVPVPWVRMAVLCGGSIAASVLITALSLVFLRRSVRPAELRAAA